MINVMALMVGAVHKLAARSQERNGAEGCRRAGLNAEGGCCWFGAAGRRREPVYERFHPPGKLYSKKSLGDSLF